MTYSHFMTKEVIKNYVENFMKNKKSQYSMSKLFMKKSHVEKKKAFKKSSQYSMCALMIGSPRMHASARSDQCYMLYVIHVICLNVYVFFLFKEKHFNNIQQACTIKRISRQQLYFGPYSRKRGTDDQNHTDDTDEIIKKWRGNST